MATSGRVIALTEPPDEGALHADGSVAWSRRRNTAMDYTRYDRVRRSTTPPQLDVVEAFARGRLSRREFIKRGTVVGLSMASISAILIACDTPPAASVAPPPRAAPGLRQAAAPRPRRARQAARSGSPSSARPRRSTRSRCRTSRRTASSPSRSSSWSPSIPPPVTSDRVSRPSGRPMTTTRSGRSSSAPASSGRRAATSRPTTSSRRWTAWPKPATRAWAA